MNQTVEKFGAYLTKQLPDHPSRFRRLTAGAYRLIGLQTGRFPSKKRSPSREYIQSFTAGLMASMIEAKKPAAVVNIFMPCEIFHALGVPAYVPEALATYISCTACEGAFTQAAEAAGAPPSFCSYHRILMGLAEQGITGKPYLIANTTLACDANQLTFRYLADKYQVPHVVIDVPYEVSEDSVLYVADQLRDMARTAEEAVGRRLDEGILKEYVARSAKTQKQFVQYLRARAGVHLPESLTPELLNIMTMHPYLGLPEAERHTQLLKRDVKEAPPIGNRKKILWMHVMPNWNDTLKEIFEGADNDRVEIIGCDMTYDSLVKMDPEHPYESLARRIVMNTFNGPGQRRIDATLRAAKKLGADGILLFCQWGCKQTQGLALDAKAAFEAEGLPTLVLDSDGCDRSNGGGGQIVTRIEAFLEQIGAGL